MVKEGDNFGFIGPNKAEKTTMIRLLTGIVAPFSLIGIIFGIIPASKASKLNPIKAIYK